MISQLPDFYRVLGVEPDADQRTIHSAFRRLARQHHPDVARNKHAPSRFFLIREAYEILSDPKKRRQYDRLIAKRTFSGRSPDARKPPSVPQRKVMTKPSPPLQGFHLALNLLGIRLDAGVHFDTLSDAMDERKE